MVSSKIVLQLVACILHLKSSIQIRLDNQKCRIRAGAVATSKEYRFHPLYVELHRCSGGDPNISNPLAKMECKPNTTKVLDIDVFNRITKKQAKVLLVNHTSCIYACSLEPSCSTNQNFNSTNCLCQCKSNKTKLCATPLQWNSTACACVCPPRKNICNELKDLNFTTCACTCKDSLRESCKWKFDEQTCHCANYSGFIRTDKAFIIMTIEMISLLVIFAVLANVIIYR